jgi:hypothetical protein
LQSHFIAVADKNLQSHFILPNKDVSPSLKLKQLKRTKEFQILFKEDLNSSRKGYYIQVIPILKGAWVVNQT